MSHRRYGLLFGVAFSFALAASQLACAQTIDDANPCAQGPVFAHDIYKRGGWDIAFIDPSKVLSKELALKASDPVYSGVTDVQVGLKSPNSNSQTIEFNRCSRDATAEKSKLFVIRVFAFKKNDRVFAYMIAGSVQNLVNGEWQACMCGGEFLLYDPDGSGSFSHLIPFTSMLPKVPEWVRGDAAIKSK